MVPEDHILPLMADLRFAPDTLFIVAEEDWRLWKADCQGGKKFTTDALPQEREGELAAPSKADGPWSKTKTPTVGGGGGKGSSWQPRRQRPHQPEDGPKGWGRPQKAKAAAYTNASQELVDIVGICNTAHRQGCGDLIWLSWSSNAKTKWTVTHGSTLIAVSARGARILHNHFEEQLSWKGHWDLCLKGALQGEEFQKIIKACHLFPSMGGFDDHISAFQNTKSPEVRECWWECYKNRQEGTREHDDQGRACSRSLPWQPWCLKQFPFYQHSWYDRGRLCEIVLPPIKQPGIWWTAACSVSKTFYKEDLEEKQRGRTKKNKQNPSFQPGTGRSRSKSPTKQAVRKWEYDRPVSQFKHAGQDLDPSFGPIRITHQQLESPDEISDFKTTNAQRRKRDVNANFERRYFTNDPAKAGLRNCSLSL